MAEFDFQKLGNDRNSQNLKRAITSPVGRLVVGDITKGEVVSVDTAEGGTATVAARRTGAILLSIVSTDGGTIEFQYSITDTTLTVTKHGSSPDGTFKFWVF